MPKHVRRSAASYGLKHYTFKQISPSVFDYNGAKQCFKFIKPDMCGIGEFVTIGNRNAITAVFIPSELLPEETDFSSLFKLVGGYNPDKHYSIIQYNSKLGGYLYSWVAETPN